MNKQRKQIIISEIKHWKQSNLLPSHYCDFLITLYAQGDDEPEDEVVNSILVQEKKNFNRKIIGLVFLVLFSSISLFVFIAYPIITFSLAVLVLLFLFGVAMRKSVASSALLPAVYISSAFLLLTMSFNIWLTYFEAYPMLLIALLLLNCGLWLFVGRLLNLLYFTISGAAGMLLIVVFLFIQL